MRGTPQQIIEKYTQLARDAMVSNDRVAAENFQQHSEHYTRMLGEAQREQDARRDQQDGQQNRPRDRQDGGYDNGDDGNDSRDDNRDTRDDNRDRDSRDDNRDRDTRNDTRDRNDTRGNRNDNRRDNDANQRRGNDQPDLIEDPIHSDPQPHVSDYAAPRRSAASEVIGEAPAADSGLVETPESKDTGESKPKPARAPRPRKPRVKAPKPEAETGAATPSDTPAEPAVDSGSNGSTEAAE